MRQVLLREELATANTLLHLTLEAGKAVGWNWDVTTGRDCWFGDLQTMFGTPSMTFSWHGEDVRRHLHPEDRERVWNAVKDAMDGHTPCAAEFRVVQEDGTVRWVMAQGQFYYSHDGAPQRMLGVAVDITERKAAEEALHHKDNELAEAQRLAGVGSWQWNPETDTVIWSDELYRIVGRDPRLPAVSYTDHSQLYTPESWDRLRRAVEEALRTGAPYELDLEMVRTDGALLWVMARGEVQRDRAGRVVGLRGTLQDISERRAGQEALRESQERLVLAAQAGRMYAYEWERASDVVVRSANCAQILGSTSKLRVTTRTQMMTTVHPDDRAVVVEATRGCTPEHPTNRVQYRVIRPDGSIIWVEKHGRALFDRNGEMQRMIGMVVDITERKLAEEALSSLSRRLIEAQEAERARIARELHDDIAQRLAMTLVALDQRRQAAETSHAEVLRQTDDVRRQIEDVSRRVHSLSHKLHSATLHHLGMTTAMQGFCEELSAQQAVDIIFAYDDIPQEIPGEISLCLFRVLQEALHNAIRHSNVRRFEVELRGASDAVVLTVRDSGVGFDPENAIKGRGLGLISMQERLKLVNGELSIDSKRERGTSIHARVPLSAGGSAQTLALAT
jgi:PAS domain S-box-containing protein